MNMARIAVGMAFDHPVGGVTVNRFCASGITALQMAADRNPRGRGDVLIAAAQESMSLVPMGGNKTSFNAEIFARDENVALPTAWASPQKRSPSSGVSAARRRTPFALESHLRAIKAQKAGESPTKSPPTNRGAFAQPRHREVVEKRRTVSLDRALARTPPLKAWPNQARVCCARQRHGGNSSQTSDAQSPSSSPAKGREAVCA